MDVRGDFLWSLCRFYPHSTTTTGVTCKMHEFQIRMNYRATIKRLVFVFQLSHIMLYSTKGLVFLTGDVNSRTGIKPDYVNNAFVRTDDYLNIAEIPMCRTSKDKTVIAQKY